MLELSHALRHGAQTDLGLGLGPLFCAVLDLGSALCSTSARPESAPRMKIHRTPLQAATVIATNPPATVTVVVI